jgi:hypothetical protein
MLEKLTVEKKGTTIKAGAIENKLSFEIRNAGAKLNKLVAQIVIPYGERDGDRSYLLRDGVENDKPLVEFTKVKPGDVGCNRNPDSKNKCVTWKTFSGGFNLETNSSLTASISLLLARDEGKAPLHLVIIDLDGNERPWHFDIEIQSTEAVKILDLTAPLFAKANAYVQISGSTLNAKRGKWRRKSGKWRLLPLTPSGKFDFKDPDPITGTTSYELIAYRDDSERSPSEPRETTVVVHAGNTWESRLLMPGELYPALLLSTDDLRVKGNKKLYGIFVNPKTKAARLYSSSSGVDGWIFESDVPPGMGESPGVIYDNKLWLIGGSSADPKGPKSNRVCCWYKKWNGSMDWKDSEPLQGEPTMKPAAAFPARNCHACAVFGGKIWVLGGLSGAGTPLQDVWTCEEKQTEEQEEKDEITAKWAGPQAAPWKPRCLFAVATTNNAAEPARLWVYGGTTHPYVPLPINELWYFQDPNQGWAEYKNGTPGWQAPPTNGPPLGPTLFGDDEGKINLGGVIDGDSGIYRRYDVNPAGNNWSNDNKHNFPWKDNFGQEDVFLVRSVEFDGRRIFWPVYYRLSVLREEKRRPEIYFI